MNASYLPYDQGWLVGSLLFVIAPTISLSILIPLIRWLDRDDEPNAEVSDGGPLTHDKPAAQSRRSLH